LGRAPETAAVRVVSLVPRTCLGAVLLWLATASAAAVVAPETALPGPGEPRLFRILDVPFVPQSEALCGGAAVAMVMRYWGSVGVYAEDFAGLVEGPDGIPTSALVTAVQQRGWRTVAFKGDSVEVGRQLSRGRPLIALIEVSPGRYHYVVIVAWGDSQVLLHDPALAPFRVMARSDLLEAWERTDSWALLILPPAEAPAEGPGEPPRQAREPAMELGPDDRCAGLVRQGVERAHADDLGGAEARLLAATALCPESGPSFRELAGVRFRQERWAEATTLARRATRLEPESALAWRLLGTSRFLDGNPEAALQAWNQLEEPRVDLLRIDGLGRTRYDVVASRLDLRPETVLTPESLRRARRRLGDVPAVSRSRLSYRPLPGGRARVDAAVVERPLFETGLSSLTATAARALVHREIVSHSGSPTGRGGLLSAGWRWWSGRPAAWLSLRTPDGLGLPGVLALDLAWEEESYRVASDRALPGTSGSESLVREERRRGAATLSDWITSDLKTTVGLAADVWDDRGAHLSAFGALDSRFAGDRVSLALGGSAWLPLRAEQPRFASWGFRAAWRSTAEPDARVVRFHLGVQGASDGAPLGLWPGAGTGHARSHLLRAHPLLEDGVVTGVAFGRLLLGGQVEAVPIAWSLGPVRLGLVVFGDVARAWERPGLTEPGPWHLDLGAGLGVRLPGGAGVFRLDAAEGVRDGAFKLSAAWRPPWPD